MGTLMQVQICQSILGAHPDAVAWYMQVPGGDSFSGSDFILFIRGPEGLEGDMGKLHNYVCNKDEKNYLSSEGRPIIEYFLKETSFDGHKLYKDIVYGRDDYLQQKKSELNNGRWKDNVNRLTHYFGYDVEVGTWRGEEGLTCLGVFVKSILPLREKSPKKVVYQYFRRQQTPQIIC